MLGSTLGRTFDLVYGTSTGAIIASMIALDYDVASMWEHYRYLAPKVMGQRLPSARTRALEEQADRIYGKRGFECFQTKVGIVATKLEPNEPMIFKSHREQLRTGAAGFKPGFGCTVADAVIASCAAYPFFKRKRVTLGNFDHRILVDGGHMANNPALLALTEAAHILEIPESRIRILSVGTGDFPKKKRLFLRTLYKLRTSRTVLELLETSTRTMDWLSDVLYGGVCGVRVNDSYTDDRYRTSFLETSVRKLDLIYTCGRQSADRREEDLRVLLKDRLSPRQAQPRLASVAAALLVSSAVSPMRTPISATSALGESTAHRCNRSSLGSLKS